jgi:hypothetical protein
MTLSSRRGVRCGLVDGLVAEHGPQDVEARPAQAPRESPEVPRSRVLRLSVFVGRSEWRSWNTKSSVQRT